MHFGGFLSSSSSGFLVPSFKNVGEERRKVEGKCCKLSDGFSSTIGLSVNQIVATCLQTANVVVDLDGRAQLQSHVADDVVSLHQQQGRTVDFLPIGKKGKKRKNKKVRK